MVKRLSEDGQNPPPPQNARETQARQKPGKKTSRHHKTQGEEKPGKKDPPPPQNAREKPPQQQAGRGKKTHTTSRKREEAAAAKTLSLHKQRREMAATFFLTIIE